jgi:TonB family protein
MRPLIATAAPQIAFTPREPVQVKAPPSPRDYLDVEEASQATLGDRLYDEKYDEWEDTFEEPQPYDTLWDRLTGRVAPVRGFVATPRGRVALLAIGLTSLLAALVLATRIRADVVATTAPQPVALPPSPSSPTPRSVDDVDLAADATARTLPMAETSAQRSTPTTATRRRVERAASAVEISEQEPIPLPNVPRFRSVEVPLTPNSGTRASEAITSVDFSSLRDPRPGPAGSLNATSTTARDYVRAVLPPGNPAPVYPPELLRGRVEGRVEAEFLVDANGRVDTRTLRIVSSTDDRFSEAVRAVLPSLRFLPAERAGAKTEEWVSMPFRFALTPQ